MSQIFFANSSLTMKIMEQRHHHCGFKWSWGLLLPIDGYHPNCLPSHYSPLFSLPPSFLTSLSVLFLFTSLNLAVLFWFYPIFWSSARQVNSFLYFSLFSFISCPLCTALCHPGTGSPFTVVAIWPELLTGIGEPHLQAHSLGSHHFEQIFKQS